jgi:hypothetical protein
VWAADTSGRFLAVSGLEYDDMINDFDVTMRACRQIKVCSVVAHAERRDR